MRIQEARRKRPLPSARARAERVAVERFAYEDGCEDAEAARRGQVPRHADRYPPGAPGHAAYRRGRRDIESGAL